MKRKTFIVSLFLIPLFIVSLSCSAPFMSQSSGSLQQTQGALGFQMTDVAIQAQQATLDAAKSTGDQEPSILPTYTALPTYTEAVKEKAPVDEDTPEPVKEKDAPTPAKTEMDMKSRIKKANVLVFEDIWGYVQLSGNRRVSMAIQQMGFSGGTVINTGDAYGNFKSALTGSAKWDLIVVSGESREGIKGEFYDYLADQIQRGAGVIVELWNMDQIINGKIQNVVGPCGISFQKDWVRQYNYDKDDESLIILQPDHPVFTSPRPNISLAVPTTYWEALSPGGFTDAGDYMRLNGGGDGKMLVGKYQAQKSDYGVLASCYNDRVFIQTFSTHDYRQSETVNLWVNMMTNALINHFNYMDELSQ